MEFSFAQLRDLAGKHSVADVPCPACMDDARTPEGRKRKCLRIYDEHDDFIRFTCARCGVKGYAKPNDGSTSGYTKKADKEATAIVDRGPLCNQLWDRSQPAIDSLVQVYLESRACWRNCFQIRFLPADGKYPPTMVSRFGLPGEPITGIHLTKLRPDGKGKAGTAADKITMGDTVGQPIVINANDELEENPIIIAEGIEDSQTFALVTGWTCWAAGTANRIPPVVETAVKQGYQKIFVARDCDWFTNTAKQVTPASKRALERATEIHPIIPIRFERHLGGYLTQMDANAFYRQHGKDLTMAMIEWCELQWSMWTAKVTSRKAYDQEAARLKAILQPRA